MPRFLALGLLVVAVLVAGAGSGLPATTTRARPATSQVSHSLYLSLRRGGDVSARVVLLSARLRLPRPDTVFLESDGSYAPTRRGSAASVYIRLDGRQVSNASTIDWRGSFDPVGHSFDAIAAVSLAAGNHAVALVGRPLAGSFRVAASANLSVLVHPAPIVAAAQLRAPAGPFDFTTLGDVGPDLPHAPLVTLPAPASPTVALGSASLRNLGHDGDGMLGIYQDGHHPGPSSSLWTVNDLCICAEREAPLYTQALLSTGSFPAVVSLDATEFPWSLAQGEDPPVLDVERRATLVAMSGMRLVGSAQSLLRSFPDLAGTVYDHWCVGSSSGWPDCPRVGSAVPLAKATISVAAGRPGVVMLLAKARVSGDESDRDGTARLWITVDGVRRGSVGIQQLAAPSGESGRTVTASYLAAGADRLRPGSHVVRVYGRADGSFIHLAYLRDVPLIWFD